MSQDLVVELSGVSEAFAGSVELYPTPANEFFTISLGDAFTANNQVSIISLSGETIAVYTLTSATEKINIASLETGVYLVSIRVDSESVVKRLIVE